MGSGKGKQRRVATASNQDRAEVVVRPWYVLTGAVSSGKTTTLNALRADVEDSHDESARMIVEEGLSEGRTVEEIRGDERDFNVAVAERSWQREAEADPERLSLFDRGLPDLVAWARIHGSEIPDGLAATARGWRYKKVFLLDQLPVIDRDGVRIDIEDAEFNSRLHDELLRAYTEVGEEVVIVPVMPVAERAKFILSHLNSEDE